MLRRGRFKEYSLLPLVERIWKDLGIMEAKLVYGMSIAMSLCTEIREGTLSGLSEEGWLVKELWSCGWFAIDTLLPPLFGSRNKQERT